jgi:3,4-dihydroxy 2-butanone 4-phosphate synthase/GTP cyclohydrolase II
MTTFLLDGTTRIPIAGSWFDVAVARRDGSDDESLVLLSPDLDALLTGTSDLAPLVRIHSQCFTGDTLGSGRCDCGAQLRYALDRLTESDRALVVYCRDHEGRGIGLSAKLKAYNLQDAGLDTYEANGRLGYPADARRYDNCASLLVELGLDRVRLLTNNPLKVEALEAVGIAVEPVPTPAFVTPWNRRYLEAKSNNGHRLGLLAPARRAG